MDALEKYNPVITSVDPAAANRIEEIVQGFVIGRIEMVHPNVLIDQMVRWSSYSAVSYSGTRLVTTKRAIRNACTPG